MAERFKILQTLSPAQFATDNSSVQIVAARVLEDAQDNEQYLQVKFTNQSSQVLTGLDVTVLNDEARIAVQHYADLNLKPGASTGSKTLIPIPGNSNFSVLTLSLTAIQFERASGVSAFDVQDASPKPSATESAKKFPVAKILLLVAALFISATFIFSFFTIFRVHVTTLENYDYSDINLLQISAQLSDSNYSLPITIFIGIYGYLLSSILAIFSCIFSAWKKRTVPLLRITPFLSLGFQIFLLATISHRSFVSFTDVASGSYILRECSTNPATPLWVLGAGISAIVYIVSLICTVLSVRKHTSEPFTEKKHISVKTVLPIIEGLFVIALPLIGISTAENHSTDIDNAEIHANLSVF